jgi:dTDP-glucose 4,6-dehydratase
VIPTIITQIASGNKRIKLGALSPTRDFNYVADTVAGFMAALTSEKSVGQVINIGSNFEVSIGDTARAIAKIMEAEIEIISDEQRLRPEKSEVERLWASNEKAGALLGWQPKYGDNKGFHRGLEETVAWFCKAPHLKLYKPEIYNL